jgi:hypothetical protein
MRPAGGVRITLLPIAAPAPPGDDRGMVPKFGHNVVHEPDWITLSGYQGVRQR